MVITPLFVYTLPPSVPLSLSPRPPSFSREKVQHRGLRETSKGDVDAVCLVVAVVDRLFPKFSYKWLADEVERNLPQELNFRHEASNALRCCVCGGGDVGSDWMDIERVDFRAQGSERERDTRTHTHT